MFLCVCLSCWYCCCNGKPLLLPSTFLIIQIFFVGGLQYLVSCLSQHQTYSKLCKYKSNCVCVCTYKYTCVDLYMLYVCARVHVYSMWSSVCMCVASFCDAVSCWQTCSWWRFPTVKCSVSSHGGVDESLSSLWCTASRSFCLSITVSESEWWINKKRETKRKKENRKVL